ncbi:MAG: PCRF domain-containing protein, partial [Rhodospirillales bacterium]
MSLEESLTRIVARYEEIQSRLSTDRDLDPKLLSELGKEFSDLGPIVEKIHQVGQLRDEIIEAQEIVQESTGDKDMKVMAEEELSKLVGRVPDEEAKLQVMLIPKDVDDARNALLEV